MKKEHNKETILQHGDPSQWRTLSYNVELEGTQ